MKDDMTKLKICGITSLADARYCAGAGVDFLGFIQYLGSPRYIAPAKAKEIIGWLYGPDPVGVFVNESSNHINDISKETGFKYAQIHGEYAPDFFKEITVPTIKAVPVHPHSTGEELSKHLAEYASNVDYFLLDTAKTGLWGGTGSTFNWDIARELVSEYPIFIAGGINPSNIEEVIDTLHPFAVDLASGVEESPGVKDFDKLAALFDAYEAIKS